jgi:hypothetical protein
MINVWEGRPPWEYAFAIECLRTKEERAAFLETHVPAHLRDMVRDQVISDITTINAWARRVASGLPLDAVPLCVVDAAKFMGISLELP